MEVNLSLASYPGYGFFEAMQRASNSRPTEAGVGPLSLKHVQLCPQNRGILDEQLTEALRTAFPDTKFRLHANVRVQQNRKVLDWANWDDDRSYWNTLAARSKALGASVYTAHAGIRSRASLSEVLNKVQRAEQSFECEVGVEHHYPTRENHFLLSTWEEMQTLLESNAKYVIDLSHIMILEKQSGIRNEMLVKELLSSDKCIEVHLSWNDGTRDQHRELPQSVTDCWWWALLSSVNPSAAIFSEGAFVH